MRLTILLLVLFVFAGCSDPKKEAVREQIETFGNTRTNMNVKFLEFEKIGEFSGKDSAQLFWRSNYMSGEFNPEDDYFIKDLKEKEDEFERLTKQLDSIVLKARADSIANEKNPLGNAYYDYMNSLSERSATRIKLVYARGDLNESQRNVEDFERFSKNLDSVYYDIYHVKYKIESSTTVDTVVFFHNTDMLADL